MRRTSNTDLAEWGSPAFVKDGYCSSHLPCIECGYDLTGIGLGSQCPECGTEAHRSLDPARLVIADLSVLRRLRLGVRLWGVCLLLATLCAPLPSLPESMSPRIVQYLAICMVVAVGCAGVCVAGLALVRHNRGRRRLWPALFVFSCAVSSCACLGTYPFAPWPWIRSTPSASCPNSEGSVLSDRHLQPGAEFSLGRTSQFDRPAGCLDWSSCIQVACEVCLFLFLATFHFELGMQMRTIPDRSSAGLLCGIGSGVIVYAGVGWIGGDRMWTLLLALLLLGWITSLYCTRKVGRAISRVIRCREDEQTTWLS